jgi:hypothetical protein
MTIFSSSRNVRLRKPTQRWNGSPFNPIAFPEIDKQYDIPAYMKIVTEQMESISLSSQGQSKTNSKLADNLSILVEKLARIE